MVFSNWTTHYHEHRQLYLHSLCILLHCYALQSVLMDLNLSHKYKSSSLKKLGCIEWLLCGRLPTWIEENIKEILDFKFITCWLTLGFCKNWHKDILLAPKIKPSPVVYICGAVSFVLLRLWKSHWDISRQSFFLGMGLDIEVVVVWSVGVG